MGKSTPSGTAVKENNLIALKKKCIHELEFSHILYVFLFPDTPDAPSNLEIESYDKRSCNLKWKAPTHDGGNPIKGRYSAENQ